MAPSPIKRFESARSEPLYQSRLPAVQSSSIALQLMMGVSPNSQMLGNMPVQLWKFPEPTDEMQERHADRVVEFLVGDKLRREAEKRRREWDSSSNEDEDDEDMSGENSDSENEDEDEDEEMNDALTPDERNCTTKDGSEREYKGLWEAKPVEGVYRLPIPKAHESAKKRESNTLAPAVEMDIDTSPDRLPTLAPHTAPIPEISIQLIDSTGTEHRLENAFEPQPAPPPTFSVNLPLRPIVARHKHDQLASNTPVYSPTRAASPPTFWQTPPQMNARPGIRKPPIYWLTGLTNTLIDWLEHPDSQSWQVALSHLTLRSLTAGDVGVSFGGSDATIINGGKIKLTRLDISASAPKPGSDPSRPLRWVLLQVNFGEGKRKFDDREYLDASDRQDAPFMLPKIYMGRKPWWIVALPVEAISSVQTVPGEREGVVRTVLTIGVPGRVPLMHGMGVDRRFADAFMHACGDGKGLIEVESRGELKL